MTTASVTIARAELAAAEAAQHEERRAHLVEQLKLTRTALIREKKQFDKMCRQITDAQQTLDALRSETLFTSDALSRLEGRKPVIADFDMTDPESREWQSNCDTLRAKLEELRTRRTALGSVEAKRIDAVNLRDHIRQLEYAEQNLLRQLRSEIAPTNVQGEVRGV
jgi:chromosome segregation ATPase